MTSSNSRCSCSFRGTCDFCREMIASIEERRRTKRSRRPAWEKHVPYFIVWKSRWRKKQIDVEITSEKFYELRTSHCHYCDSSTVMEFSHIERLDNNQGFSASNSIPVCRRCARARDGLTEEQFLQWCGRVLRCAEMRAK